MRLPTKIAPFHQEIRKKQDIYTVFIHPLYRCIDLHQRKCIIHIHHLRGRNRKMIIVIWGQTDGKLVFVMRRFTVFFNNYCFHRKLANLYFEQLKIINFIWVKLVKSTNKIDSAPFRLDKTKSYFGFNRISVHILWQNFSVIRLSIKQKLI